MLVGSLSGSFLSAGPTPMPTKVLTFIPLSSITTSTVTLFEGAVVFVAAADPPASASAAAPRPRNAFIDLQPAICLPSDSLPPYHPAHQFLFLLERTPFLSKQS